MIDDVEFFVSGGQIHRGTLGADPVDRNYLAVFGNGHIWVRLPRPARRIDISAANAGGGPIQVDVMDQHNSINSFQVPPENAVYKYTTLGDNLRFVKIDVQSGEFLLWKVCYVPE